MDDDFESALEALDGFSWKSFLLIFVVVVVIAFSYRDTNEVMQRQVQAMLDDFEESTPNTRSFMGAYSLCRMGAGESNGCALEAAYLVEPLMGKRDAAITLSGFRLVRANMKRFVKNYDIWCKALTFEVWREGTFAENSGKVEQEKEALGFGRY